jgi:hypothetical protein
MVRVHESTDMPSDGELLFRMLRSGPRSVLTGLLDRIENQWFATGDLRAAERALKALLAEDRVRGDKELLDRALAFHQRLDDLRDEREARVPARPLPPRIAEISRRPEVASYRSRLMGRGSASMVNAGT